MTDKELADQVAVLLLAGGETTSAAISWSLHLLDGHPEIVRALHTEVDTVLGGEVAGWTHLPQLELTARVVREALRLYPPAWVVPRTSMRETQLAGHTIPAGSTIIFSSYVLHRLSAYYPEPHRFDPDRWLPQPDDTASAPRGSFLPFGAGATKCLGEDFASAEATLALASLLARWNLTPESNIPRYSTGRIVLVPHSLRVRLSRRSTPPPA